METLTQKASKELKELIIINNDRYEGYKKAAEEIQDADLKTLFHIYSLQSQQFSNELQHLFPEHEYTPDPEETTISGKLYRVFMDIKSTFEGKDRKGILSSCEFGEDQAKKVYNTILEDSDGIEYDILEIIRNQRFDLQSAHDKIKALRDSA
ncbi:MAG TPA: PA2169 family four-helix-bundle protein [Bacteroidia bacterium]|jgi:uncharacterized protein (TIGR02284 family)|nr:PA2169 family four-helix-bundle protein [Bacteroidia bacterium]